jgi:hypothetical protein
MTRTTSKPTVPPAPATLLIGGWVLEVQEITEVGAWDSVKRVATGVSGTAWTGFSCGVSAETEWVRPGLLELSRIRVQREVVAKITQPGTQVLVEVAERIQPGIRLGETLDVSLAVPSEELVGTIRARRDLLDWYVESKEKGQVLVAFDHVTIELETDDWTVGRIVEGKAVYPTPQPVPKKLRLMLDGFAAELDSLEITPKGATADVTLTLPSCIGSADSCRAATLHLGRTAITPKCELYAERPAEAYGPWIVGDTGLVVEGKGFTADFSSSRGVFPWPAAWKGLVLGPGTASGDGRISPNSNTGYLAGRYVFTGAVITADGFQGQLRLAEAYEFESVQPLGYTVALEGGTLEVGDCRIVSGLLGPGWLTTPARAACDGNPGTSVEAQFAALKVLPNLDLFGAVTFTAGSEVAWGELTHPGDELIAWQVEVTSGYFYLPARPLSDFNPETGAGFVSVSVGWDPATSQAEIEGLDMAGLTIWEFEHLRIFSPDHPGGTGNPLEIHNTAGWLRVGSLGVDGEIRITYNPVIEELGDKARTGYIGNEPFRAWLFEQDKEIVLAQYVASAVYDSCLDGKLTIPPPCDIRELEFVDMELTSTAHLVGGTIVLPVSGVKLDYWQLDLVPTGDPAQAGVVSVRTGRLVFTAAGISEPRHFAQPFALTWGEILADGNLGQLYFDYNSYGQRFDDIPFSASHLALSPYVTGSLDGYLAACGTVHLSFFGPHFVNIHDARHNVAAAPFDGRRVTVPKAPDTGCLPTDLRLRGNWDDSLGLVLASFDFPDAEVDYHEAAQDGFIGTGSSDLRFLHSDGLAATIEIHGDTTDICLSSEETHDLDLGLFARVGGMSGVYGCARIEGPLLQRIALYGILEQATAAGMGILGPKTGFVAEMSLVVTPGSIDLMTSGDLLLSAAGAAVDVSASVHLFNDFVRGSAEGEIAGRIDCNSVVGGLEGEGQITWYVDATKHWLQGKLKMEICSWTGGVGLEGGLFLGTNCPRDRAWVLAAGGEKFGVSSSTVPDPVTGIYGYGQISFGVQWYVFGGGIEIFVGMGFFGALPPAIRPRCGIHVYGEILGGLVSAEAWAILTLHGPPFYFEGSVGLEGCVLWVICASIEVTAGFGSDGFYLV